MRSLVADLGTDVGVGAHLTELRRTRSGRFAIADAIALDAIDPATIAAHLIPPGAAVPLPIVTVSARVIPLIFGGVQVSLAALGLAADSPSPFQLVDDTGRLLAGRGAA